MPSKKKKMPENLKPLILFVVTELSNEKHGWKKSSYYKKFDVSFSTVKDNVERVDASKLSIEEFIKNYESTFKPVVLTNVQKSWKAKEKWTLEVSR